MSLPNSHPPSTAQGVRILSRAFDSWNVEFNIDVQELLDQKALLHHLRDVKQVIAQTQSVAENCLMFDGIIRKTRNDKMVDVVVRIRKKPLEKGAPKVSFASAIGADESMYTHMSANLDIYYLDEFEHVITHDRIMQTIRKANITAELIDGSAIVTHLKDVLHYQSTSRNIPIARGELPEPGNDAEIEFFFQAVAERHAPENLYSSRRVHAGDLLCRKTPPTTGLRDGFNVIGDALSPRSGVDIELIAGKNTTLSLDGLEIVADCDGIAVVRRSTRRVQMLSGVKEIPESVEIRVNTIIQIDGQNIVDIATSDAVEIIGDLRIGSRILSDAEVYVSGNVEEGASIEANNEIVVAGNISGAALSSHDNIVAQQDVVNSRISASGDVTVTGKVSGSLIMGEHVEAGSISGTKILARKSITLGCIDVDENHLISTLCVGMHDFFLQRLKDNQEFIEAAQANLERIEIVVGREIVDQVNSTNIQIMVMKMLARLRNENTIQTRKQVDVYRKLVEAVPPTRALIEQKKRECVDLANKLHSASAEQDHVIVVRERVGAPAAVNLNGTHRMLEPPQDSIKIVQ